MVRPLHAAPRDRLAIVAFLAAMVAGVLLASDDDRWMASSLVAILAATLMSVVAHSVDGEWAQSIAALAWTLAAVVSARWLVLPAVYVPLAIVTLVGAPYVVAAEVRKHRAVQREAHTRCVVCGYDLRASKSYCPECGTRIDGEVDRLRRIAAELRASRGGRDPTLVPPTLMPPAASSSLESPAAPDANDAPR